MTTPFGGTPAPPQQQPFGGQQQAPQPFGQPAPAPVPQQAPAASNGAPWSVPSEVSQGDEWNPRELNTALLLIKPLEYRTGIVTKHSRNGETSDMLVADITIVGATKDAAGNWAGCSPEQSLVLHNTGIFQGRLIGKLKGKVGQGMVLGRLQVGPIGPNGNPEFYDLEDPSPQDQAQAMAWYNAQPSAAPPF